MFTMSSSSKKYVVITVSDELRKMIVRCLDQARVGGNRDRIQHWQDQLTIFDQLNQKANSHV